MQRHTLHLQVKELIINYFENNNNDCAALQRSDAQRASGYQDH